MLPPNESVECPACKGTGQCVECDGLGRVKLMIYVDRFGGKRDMPACSFCMRPRTVNDQLFRSERGVSICTECLDFIGDLRKDEADGGLT